MKDHKDTIDEILEKVRNSPKTWSEEEVLEQAYDPSHLRSDVLFDYLEGKLDDRGQAEVEAHAARCDFCLHQLAELGRVLAPPHPSLAMLIQYAANVLAAPRFEAVQAHLQQDTCPRCKRFVLFLEVVPFMKRIVEEVKRGTVEATERGAEILKALSDEISDIPKTAANVLGQIGSAAATPEILSILTRLLASEGSVCTTEGVTIHPGEFAQGVVFEEHHSEDKTLTLIVQSREEGSLTLVAEVKDPSWKGRKVYILATDGDGEKIFIHTVAMTERSPGFWEGELGEEQIKDWPTEVYLIAFRQ